MDARKRLGFVMVLVGTYWLLSHFFPLLTRLTDILFSWPVLLILIGLMILFKKSNRT